MRRHLLGVIIVLSLLFSVACNLSQPGLTDNGFPLAQAWSYAAGDMLFSYAVGEDWVVIATPEGLSALDTATGSLLWENDFLVKSEPASIVIFDDKLVAIGFEKNVKVFSISGGELGAFSLADSQGVGLAQIAALSDQYI